jgi:DNA polymerase III subunit gamma/tau
MRGDLARALTEVRDQYDIGADPAMLLGDLAEFTHFVTRVKIVPTLADDVSLTETERTRGRAFAAKLSMRVLARTWQMLLKGMEEVAAAGRPLAAAEMVFVRIAYAADLPTPDEVVRSLGEGARGNRGAPSGQPAPRAEMPARAEAPRAEGPRGGPRAALAAAAPAEMRADEPETRGQEASVLGRALASFEDLVALAAERRDLTIKSALERDVRLVRFEDGRLEISLEPSAPKSLTGELSKKLADWTGRRWMVTVSAEPGMPSLYTQAQTRKSELKDGVRTDPLVQAVLARFPGAEIVDVRPPAGAAAGSDDTPFDAAAEAGPADDEL